MKSFTLIFTLLLLSSFALAMEPEPWMSGSDGPRSLAVRRLGLPAQIKAPLKWAVSTIVNTGIICAASALTGKLSSIPMFKDLPVAKGVAQLSTFLQKEVKKHTDAFIDGMRRARMVRRRMNIIGDIGNKLKGAGQAIGNAANAAGKDVIKAGKWIGGVAKNAQDLAVKLDGLTGGHLSTGLANSGCPLVANAVFEALDKALLSVGFPFTPPCIKDGIEAGCRTGVDAFFRKQRILRRLASLKRDLKNF